ncbi:ABC transporter permease [Georgenia faecalis]|uniref:ABC transporter permease n=1 Tax=Georgenia faecalis TaxID=2483799 RepID=UPI000FD8824E|nr:ABC transporter permease [Georgenia faecalis]
MSTLTAPTATRGLGALAASEARLFLRDVGGSFFALAFPSVLLVGVGLAIPGMRDPITDAPPPWAGMLPIHLYLPVVLAAVIATPALTTLPVVLATYREQGILRRLSTTPMRPQGVLVAQVAVNLAALVVAAVLALTVGALTFDAPLPDQPLVALLAFVLGAAAMFGVGLLIAARAPKASSASGLGMLVFFPMLLFAGMWTPGPAMPETLATIGAYTPLGAASQAMTTAWFHGDFPALEAVVMLAYVVVLYPLATKLFRWS